MTSYVSSQKEGSMKVFALSLLSITAGTGLLVGAEPDGSFDRSLSVSGPVNLDVKTDSGGITVKAGSSGSVHVHAVLKAQHGRFEAGDVEGRIRELERNPPVQQNGNRVIVGQLQQPGLLRGISMHLEIETPSETQVHARADSGGIQVSGIHGPVDCKTDSGGIAIQDVGSNVRAEADSGGIHVDNVHGSLFARVDSGGIKAANVAGEMDVQSDSGHLRLSQTTAAPIHARADSGGVSVTLAPGAGYDLSAEADSGHISVPEMTVGSSFSRHHIEGKIRGGGPPVNIRVDSGAITVN
jgi:Putative adhesin